MFGIPTSRREAPPPTSAPPSPATALLSRPLLRVPTLLALALLALLSAPPMGAAAAPAAQANLDAGAALRVGQPRAAVLTVYEGAAETFPALGAEDTPAELRPEPGASTAPLWLWADHETLLMPLTAGVARHELAVAALRDGIAEPLGEDAARVVAFGPERRAGRLGVALRLAPGRYVLQVSLRSAVRPVGTETWTEDASVQRLVVLVLDPNAPLDGDAPRAALDGRSPAPRASDGSAGRLARVALDVTDAGALPSESARDPAPAQAVPPAPLFPSAPRGGIPLGAQRGVAGHGALGALNLPEGHDETVRAHAGQALPLWTDVELWWAADAAATGRVALEVFGRAADGGPEGELLARVVRETEPIAGPRLAGGALRTELVLDEPGRHALVARLSVAMRPGPAADAAGPESAEDVDLIPFVVHVRETPTTGAISGVVWGRARGDASAPSPARALLAPVAGVTMLAHDEEGRVQARTRSAEDGSYLLEGLAPGAYLVHAAPAPANWLDQWYRAAERRVDAQPVSVLAGQTVERVDFALRPGGTVAGRVTDREGRPLAGIEIALGPLPPVATPADPAAPSHDLAGPVYRTRTNEEGDYALDRLPPGRYWLRGSDPQGRYLTRYWKDAAASAEADPISLAEGGLRTDTDLRLPAAGGIAGRVRAESADGVPRPLPEIRVEAYEPDDPGRALARTRSGREGRYELGPLAPGRYLVRASDPDGRWAEEWFEEAAGPDAAMPVPVTAGAWTDGVDFSLSPRQAGARILLDPAELTLGAGQEGRLAVAIADVESLGAFEVVLEWKPEVFRVDGVELGSFLGSSGREVIPVEPSIDNEAGRLAFAAASLGDAPGPSGGGILFQVALRGRTEGRTPLELASSTLTDPRAREIAHERADGLVVVGGCLFGDVNCDCRVDIRDVMAVAMLWGAVEGDPDWDPRADLRPDGQIDIVDVQLVAGAWGSSCEGGAPGVARAEIDALGGAQSAGPASRGMDGDRAGEGRDGADAEPRLVAPEDARVGQLVELRLDLAEATPLSGFEVALAVDPARLRPVGAEIGGFLGAGGRRVLPLGPAIEGGRLRFGAAALPGAEAARGDGTLARFTFEVLAEGSAAVAVDELLLSDALGDTRPLAMEGVRIDAAPVLPELGRALLPLALR